MLSTACPSSTALGRKPPDQGSYTTFDNISSPLDERYIRQMEFRWILVQMLDNDSDVLDGWCRWRDAHREVGILAICSEVYCPRVLGQWFDGIRFYAAASSPRRSRRTWAGLR